MFQIEMYLDGLMCLSSMHPKQEGNMRLLDSCTRDGSTDSHGKPALKRKTGGWKSGTLLLGKFNYLVVGNSSRMSLKGILAAVGCSKYVEYL